MPRKRSPEPESALYVRLPAKAADKLDRAASVLGIAKKDLVAGLVSKYVDPDSRRGLSALGALSGTAPALRGGASFTAPALRGGASTPRRVNAGDMDPVPGTYSFRPHEAPEVLNAEQAAELLQLDEKLVLQLAQAGKLPGRKLGTAWRFSRAALIAWLSAPTKP